MKKAEYFAVLIFILASCTGNKQEPDAWGNFESEDVMVSSESNGKILSVFTAQGDLIARGDLIAITDTTMVSLQIKELNSSRGSVISRLASVDAENNILDQQMANLEVNIARVEKMLADKAATPKQLDDLTGQLEVLRRKKEASNTRKNTIRNELEIIKTKKALLEEQYRRCFIKSPLNGTVLEKYAEAGEITAAGKPLIRLADLTNMELKVYVSGAQLAGIKIGDECTVRIDSGIDSYRNYPGKIIHISDRAEFTPKIIQTKEERVYMVYAVKIRVANDGSIKSGMPGEVLFDNRNP